MSKPKINKIVIEVAGKKLEFTPDEAKELKTILADLFGGEKVTYVDRWHGYWPWYQGYPYYGNTILCGTTNYATGKSNLGSSDLNNIQGTLTGTYSGQSWNGSLDGGTVTLMALQG